MASRKRRPLHFSARIAVLFRFFQLNFCMRQRGNTHAFSRVACKIHQYTEVWQRHEQSPHQTMHGTPCFAKGFSAVMETLRLLAKRLHNVFKNVMRYSMNPQSSLSVWEVDFRRIPEILHPPQRRKAFDRSG